MFSCNDSGEQSIPVSKEAKKHSNAKVENMISSFKEAIPLDSGTTVLYPLTFNNFQDANESRGYSSSSDIGPYWNIAFYNTKDGISKLLTSGAPVRITTFQKVNNFMVYAVTSLDYNGDGQLNQHDPTYLFTSDLNGNQFKQITPDSMHVSSFDSINKSNILLIQVQVDTNKDKKFDSSDQFVPMIFDTTKGEKAKNTFSNTFTKNVNAVFNKTYKK